MTCIPEAEFDGYNWLMGRTLVSPVLEEAVQRRVDIVGLTVKQYDWLIEQGKFPGNLTTELIDGFIVRKDRSAVGEDPLTIGDRHRTAVLHLAELNPEFRRLGCFIQSQQPIWIPPKSEPEPDLSVISGNIDNYRNSKPALGQIFSVIEVADNSLGRDLGHKLQMYAKSKIPQYVVVNLVENAVLVHHHPSRGKYSSPDVLRAGDKLQISAGRNRFVEIAVKNVL